jgi:nucleotide-binding universal stress UspA family protein
MGPISNILFPVNFTPLCAAMGAYVKRAAAVLGARVSLIHVCDPVSHSGFELYARMNPAEIAEEHYNLAREKLYSSLADEFPVSEYPRILATGEPAAQIAETARRQGFDLIMMPTHSGTFRRMLLGSTTAKVLNDADCPVLTSTHALTIAPRPLEHREYICTIGLGENSERVLRYAQQMAVQAKVPIRIIHAIQTAGPDLPIQLDLAERVQSQERQQAHDRIDDLLRKVGVQAEVHVVVGPVKQALLEAARQYDADALLIGRGSQSGAEGRLRDLTYVMIRDSPFPVLSI